VNAGAGQPSASLWRRCSCSIDARARLLTARVMTPPPRTLTVEWMQVVSIQPFGILDAGELALVSSAFDLVGEPSELRVYEIRPPTGRRYRLVAPADAAIVVGSQVDAEEFGGVIGVNTEGRQVHIYWTSRLSVI
jgi:hypothetical protein